MNANTNANVNNPNTTVQLPAVTVIIPNHNYVDYVAYAINSVVNQDYPNRKIMVIDDNSKDGSFERVKNLIDNPKPFQIIRDGITLDGFYGYIDGIPLTLLGAGPLGGGPSQSRNLGVLTTAKQTDIYGFLDADDEYLPGKISKSVYKICENPSLIGMVYSDYFVDNKLSNLITREFKEPFSRSRLMQECIINNDSLVSKLALSEVGLYDISMNTCEDYDLWVRLTEKFLAVHIPECLVKINVTKYNSTDSVAKAKWQQNYQKVFHKAQQRLQDQSQEKSQE
jgi:glycosyltransferase involved in cell wall biosynthesis